MVFKYSFWCKYKLRSFAKIVNISKSGPQQGPTIQWPSVLMKFESTTFLGIASAIGSEAQILSN